MRDVWAFRELLLNLVRKELKVKYKDSVLGFVWSLARPMFLLGIYYVVFDLVLGAGIKDFAFYLFAGLIAWDLFGSTLSAATMSIVGNAGLIKKVYFPREILVAASVASFDVSFLIELGVLAVALLVFGNFVLPWLLMALLIVAIMTLFVLGVSLALSVLNVYFRDVQHFVGILLMLWFYASPIVYPITYVPKEWQGLPLRHIYTFNPMVRFAETMRDVLYDLRFPGLTDMVFLVVVSAATLAVGMWIFSRLEPRLAEEL